MNLIFNPKVAIEKPTNNSNCPFCDVKNLTGIIEKTNDFIWLENKYRTIEDSYQTLIIESNEHLGDISTYSYEYNRKLINYAITRLFNFRDNHRFRSVTMFRNFGKLSGGSLRHPHIQIVGFNKLDINNNISKKNFEGLAVRHDDSFNTEINISLSPVMGYTEFNVCSYGIDDFNLFADYIKDIVNYIVSYYYGGKCNSYNLFFYTLESGIVCKIVPRFIVSPYYVGYKQSQLNNYERLIEIKKEFLEVTYEK